MTDYSFSNFHLSRDSRGVFTVSLDVPERPYNVLTEEVVTELQAVVDLVESDSSIRMVVFSSDKDSGFLAGADVGEIRRIRSRQMVGQMITTGQRLFDRIERLPMPTLAVISGPCLGGGLELALACRYRFARDDSTTRLGFPEIELGLMPAWGGTQRLPEKIGLAESLRLILSGRKISAREAVSLGLVDHASSPDRFQNQLNSFIADRLAGKAVSVSNPGLLSKIRDRTRIGRWFVLRSTRQRIARRSRHYPALSEALNAVERGLRTTRAEGFGEERRAFVDLLFTPTCRNLMTLFLQRERARKSGTWVNDEWYPTRRVQDVAVIGAGAMGAGIAQLLAYQGHSVVLKDIDQRALDKGIFRIKSLMKKAVRRGLLTEQEASQRLSTIVPCTDWRRVANVDLAIEAVPEYEDLKADVFHQLDDQLAPEAMIVSNTSALSIGRLASATHRPAHVAGLHFFNPVHRMQLIEVVRTEDTDDDTIATLVEFARSLGKVPLVVADRPGFLVNRVLFRYLDEAVRMVKEGLSADRVDRSARIFGMPMGPLELLDQVGLHVAADVAGTLTRTGDEPSPTAELLAEMVARGWTGKGAGAGFYQYRKGRRGRPMSLTH
ncbi:MAG: 3-hydroxyacyl-CoA dehydrogenase NAD-binding domain-containing protein, partial [Planctomycetes bacterium]|nr:3-hydroxyacyl-CoA dehydrogenase NAD-binding domain-containing protein [Planctomycetota bacterium]